jgi:hypothetical protein
VSRRTNRVHDLRNGFHDIVEHRGLGAGFGGRAEVVSTTPDQAEFIEHVTRLNHNSAVYLVMKMGVVGGGAWLALLITVCVRAVAQTQHPAATRRRLARVIAPALVAAGVTSMFLPLAYNVRPMLLWGVAAGVILALDPQPAPPSRPPPGQDRQPAKHNPPCDHLHTAGSGLRPHRPCARLGIWKRDRMRIAISGLVTPRHLAGVGRYLAGLLGGFAALDDDDEITVYVGADCPEEILAVRDDRIRFVRLRLRHDPRLVMRPLYLAWQQVRPAAASAEVLHVPDLVPTVGRRMPTVTSLHDLAEWEVPDKYPPARRAYRRLAARAIARWSDRVLVPTSTTRNDLVARLGLSADRVVVAPFGVDHRFLRAGLDDAPAPVAGRYLLYVGSDLAHKNLDRLRQPPQRSSRAERPGSCSPGWPRRRRGSPGSTGGGSRHLAGSTLSG